MNENQISSLWYDTSLEWGVTLPEAEAVKVEDMVVASMFFEDVPF